MNIRETARHIEIADTLSSSTEEFNRLLRVLELDGELLATQMASYDIQGRSEKIRAALADLYVRDSLISAYNMRETPGLRTIQRIAKENGVSTDTWNTLLYLAKDGEQFADWFISHI